MLSQPLLCDDAMPQASADFSKVFLTSVDQIVTVSSNVSRIKPFNPRAVCKARTSNKDKRGRNSEMEGTPLMVSAHFEVGRSTPNRDL